MHHSIMTRRLAAVLAFSFIALGACGKNEATVAAPPSVTQAELQTRLDALQADKADIAGFAVALIHPDGTLISAATGSADPDGRAMTADTPVRLASITKTFVAASVLRLWEDDLIDLDTPINGLISDAHNSMLIDDGYDTGGITVRHLLMHAGGLDDHFTGDAFRSIVMSDPSREWTRTDQLQLLVDNTDPLSAPGEKFTYSDTGYILLGEIIERVTGEPLSQAVWRLAKLDEVGLENAWWDAVETPATGAPTRAHQWVGDIDTFVIHGSVDAYGGGGIVASVEETALFFSALFGGEIFDNPETLNLMMEAPGHPKGSPYRIGLFANDHNGARTFGHGGFWGTDVAHLPDHGVTIAGASLNASGIGDLRGFRGRDSRSR